jgi:type II secretory pathway pseudopilin PulG
MHELVRVALAVLACTTLSAEAIPASQQTAEVPAPLLAIGSSPQASGSPTLAVRVIEMPDDGGHAAEREKISDAHDASDLDAQVRTAVAAERQVVLAGVTLLTSVLGLVAVVRTLRASNDAAKAALASAQAAEQSIMQAAKAQRAWVGLEQVQSKLYVNPDKPEEGGVTLQFILRNNGDTPALKFRSRVQVSFVADQGYQTAAQNVPSFVHMSSEPPLMLTPGQKLSTQPVLIRKPTIDLLEKNQVAMFLHVFVTYEDVFHEGIQRHSEFTLISYISAKSIDGQFSFQNDPVGPQNGYS